jgi:hypothetical protein
MSELSCCGIRCKECYCFGSLCKGCNELEGKVFHVPDGNTCSIYECSINKNKFEHCGGCKEIPCSIWKGTRDPKYTDEEFDAIITERMNALKGR